MSFGVRMHRGAPTVLLSLALVSLSCSPRGGGDALEERDRRVSEAIARARESAVALEYSTTGGRSGARRVATGVVVNEEGDVLSIRIDPPPADTPIVARDASGRRLPVQWIASDAETGLTLLRIEGGQARPGRVSARAAKLGSEVLLIGNPFGLGHSVTRGAISGLDRRLELGPRQLGGLIQIDAPIHPGDSGALVTDLRGDWLGLIRSGLAAPDAERTRDHDLGFAITAQDALWVVEQLRARGRVDRAYLGVRLDPGALGSPPGAGIDDVLDGTPAARAGLRPGDRVVAFDGHPVQAPRDLTDRLDRTVAGTAVVVEYVRGGSPNRLTVQTGSRPPLEAEPARTEMAKTDEPSSPLPQAVLERIERLERRVKELEREKRQRTVQQP